MKKEEYISYGKMSSAYSFGIFSAIEQEKANIDSIDSCMTGTDVTLIKMDIKGTVNTILNYALKLAICVYHRM